MLSMLLPLLALSAAAPLNLAREANWSPPAGSPVYTGCSFVQQVGLVNVFACDVLNGNTVSIPITVEAPVSLPKRDAEANWSPPAGSPVYTGCSFVQQIGAANVFLCDVLNGNTISIPITASLPVSLPLVKREAVPTWSPPSDSPKYTDCSFVQQIGLVNIFACDVLNGNTISIPITVEAPVSIAKREADAEANWSPPSGSPVYTGCSFVQQIGLLNLFLCDVLNNNTISIPITVSLPVSLP